MTVKLLLLKSGEDIISDIKEMVVGDEDNLKIAGYYLYKPCVVKMTAPSNVPEKFDEKMDPSQASFQVTLFPWMPLTKDTTIPIPADWVITIVNPTEKLKNMYMEDVINYGKENGKSVNDDQQSSSDKSD